MSAPYMPTVLHLDPTRILGALGIKADPWQAQILRSSDPEILINCCRQAGKSTTVAALAISQALFTPGSLTLLLSPSERQSTELFRKAMAVYRAVRPPITLTRRTEHDLEMSNGSRIVSLPGKEGTIRGYSGVNLLIIDEAARVPDDLYRAVRPMLAVSKGRIIALSTPFGLRGWFWRAWESDAPFRRFKATYKDCPRITEDHVARDRVEMGDNWVDQEYLCVFAAMEGLVYPTFSDCVVDTMLPPIGNHVGGIDFGWRNPFAALWGVHERKSDVLYIDGERYARQTLLHEHISALRKHPHVCWHADPAGATEIGECRSAGLHIMKSNNDISLGIAAVTARVRTGRLKVARASCPNLIAESNLYRYPNAQERVDSGSEKPVDDHNHALAALRYLIARLDHRFIARLRRAPVDAPPEPTPDEKVAGKRQHEYAQKEGARPWLRLNNPYLWPTTTIRP